MKSNKIYMYMLAVVLGICILSGCKTASIVQHDIVLLPEDRIYTVPPDAKVHVFLDKKDLGEMVFPYTMKLVHESVLERQEQQVNDALLDKVKAQQDKNKWVGILGGIIAAMGGLGTIIGVIAKFKGKAPPK